MRAILVGAVAFASFIVASRSSQATHRVEECKAPQEWFKASGTDPVPVDFAIADNGDECAFYKWAWQSFLWLTQTDSGEPTQRFILFKTPNDLFDAAGDRKLQLTASPMGTKDGKRVLSLSVRNSPRTSRDVTAIAIEQAGSQGVLVDQNNRAVYFGMHVNDRFVSFIRQDLNLKDPEKIKDVDPKKQFPPGCLELKSSWRVLSDQEKQPDKLRDLGKRYFVTEAVVPTLKEVQEDGQTKIKADPTMPRPEMVALVGLHVVGTIVNHPEFIWASFEHIDNAPVLPKQDLGNNEPVDNQRDYTFYRKGKSRGECNVNPTNPIPNLKLTSAQNQTLVPIVDIFRQFNSGDDLVSEDDLVKSLNDSVHSQVMSRENLAIYGNYKLIGAVWFKNPVTDFVEGKDFRSDDLLVGEKKLSNTTMETFTQPDSSKPNCFRCHNTKSEPENNKTIPGLRIKISHIIRNAYLRPQ